jgi:hypothetical protein
VKPVRLLIVTMAVSAAAATFVPSPSAGAAAPNQPLWVTHVQKFPGGISNGVRATTCAGTSGRAAPRQLCPAGSPSQGLRDRASWRAQAYDLSDVGARGSGARARLGRRPGRKSGAARGSAGPLGAVVVVPDGRHSRLNDSRQGPAGSGSRVRSAGLGDLLVSFDAPEANRARRQTLSYSPDLAVDR